jgi:hypothetical protein
MEYQKLLDTAMKVGPEISPEKTVCAFMCCHKNAEQNHNIKTVNKSFKKLAECKYMGNSDKNYEAHNILGMLPIVQLLLLT